MGGRRYYKNEAHYQWIIDKRKYNLRMDSIQPEPMFFGAKYLLLHHKGVLKTSDLWRISRGRPSILNRAEMIKLGYSSPRDFYLVYSIEKVTDTEFKNMCWDISKLSTYKSGHQSAKPFAVSLEDLMQVVCPKS